MRAEKVFISIRALSLEQGLTNDYLPETMTDRAILLAGRQVIVVADHTKLDRVSTAFVAPLCMECTPAKHRQLPPRYSAG